MEERLQKTEETMVGGKRKKVENSESGLSEWESENSSQYERERRRKRIKSEITRASLGTRKHRSRER